MSGFNENPHGQRTIPKTGLDLHRYLCSWQDSNLRPAATEADPARWRGSAGVHGKLRLGAAVSDRIAVRIMLAGVVACRLWDETSGQPNIPVYGSPPW